MKWDYWLDLYLSKYCMAQGLRPLSVATYKSILGKFRTWLADFKGVHEPDQVTQDLILDYVRYLRLSRNNGDCAVNTQLVSIRNFYRALVAMEQIAYTKNPTLQLPRIKAPKRKMKEVLSYAEVAELLKKPRSNTVLGLRDRAILTLLYGTGIRASECATAADCDIDFDAKTIRVLGKGGHQRIVPLNETVLQALINYKKARGDQEAHKPFFRTRKKRGATRGMIYERVKRFSRLARIGKKVTPHVLRHTFATHLLKLGEKLIVLKELLGHRQISSTQVYLHLSGEDLRDAIEKHPVRKLLGSLEEFLPTGRLRFQHPKGKRFAFNN
jgi:site-specific recombinase XerD